MKKSGKIPRSLRMTPSAMLAREFAAPSSRLHLRPLDTRSDHWGVLCKVGCRPMPTYPGAFSRHRASFAPRSPSVEPSRVVPCTPGFHRNAFVNSLWLLSLDQLRSRSFLHCLQRLGYGPAHEGKHPYRSKPPWLPNQTTRWLYATDGYHLLQAPCPQSPRSHTFQRPVLP